MSSPLKIFLASLMLIGFSMGVSARADTLTFSGNTFTNPTGTFNRPVEGGASLSLLATDVAYSAYRFTVTTGGAYDFLSTSQESFLLDPFLVLYANSFDPASSLTNYLAANDDFNGSVTQSGFSVNLLAGTPYFLVTTGHSVFDSGSFVNTVNGPGAVEPIPEPATLFLLGSGLACVAARLRRRRSEVN